MCSCKSWRACTPLLLASYTPSRSVTFAAHTLSLSACVSAACKLSDAFLMCFVTLLLSVFPSLCICPSVRLSLSLPLSLPACLSACPSACLPAWLCAPCQGTSSKQHAAFGKAHNTSGHPFHQYLSWVSRTTNRLAEAVTAASRQCTDNDWECQPLHSQAALRSL